MALVFAPLSGAWALRSTTYNNACNGNLGGTGDPTKEYVVQHKGSTYVCEDCPANATCDNDKTSSGVTCNSGYYAVYRAQRNDEMAISGADLGNIWQCAPCSTIGNVGNCPGGNANNNYSEWLLNVTCATGYVMIYPQNRCTGDAFEGFHVKRCMKCPYGGKPSLSQGWGALGYCYLDSSSGTQTDNKGDFTISSGMCYVAGDPDDGEGVWTSYDEFDLPANVVTCYESSAGYMGGTGEFCLCNGYS